MKKLSILLTLMSVTLSSPPVWGRPGLDELVEQRTAAQRAAMAYAAFARRTSGERIGTQEAIEESAALARPLMNQEFSEQDTWIQLRISLYTMPARNDLITRLLRPMTLLEFARRYS